MDNKIFKAQQTKKHQKPEMDKTNAQRRQKQRLKSSRETKGIIMKTNRKRSKKINK